jgi:hypothetical protein
LRRDLARALRILVIPTLGVVVVFAFVPGRSELAVRAYALLLAAVGLGLMVAALRRGYARETPLRPPAQRRSERREIPATLSRLEQEVILGSAGSFDLHHRLRPRLRRLAAELLAIRPGIDLDREPELAHRALGDDAWDLTRKDRPPPVDRLARGIAISDLDRVVQSLERL